MSQTAYNVNMPKCVVGLIGDASGSAKVKDTYITTAEIVFGRGVVLDTSGTGTCKLPASGSDQFLGVAVRDITEPNGSASVDNAYPDESAACIMKQGTVWVEVEEAITPSDDVYVRHTANGGNTTKGIFRTDSDSSNALQVANARWLTSSETVNGRVVALLELNIP